MKSEPVKIKELKKEDRIKGFDEVVLGYSEEEAVLEANRCLQCNNPTCIEGCPVEIDIKKFIDQIAQKDFKSAYLTIKEKNNFPSICGRVCPAEYQCRKSCVLTKKDSIFACDNSINIHFLERFIGDWGIINQQPPACELRSLRDPAETKSQAGSNQQPENKSFKNKKVAVVGSGPAGIACAGELARQGIEVVIFEALHKAGGVLSYGIPAFRLPPEVLNSEIEYIKKLGVKIVKNILVGKTKTLDEISQEFDFVFLGLGAGTPSFLNIEGENLCNVYSANEFLTRINLMGAHVFPKNHTPINIGKKIVVIGGGNTAMDAARIALRLQTMSYKQSDITVCYRRSESEMPARRLEIKHALEEGIKFNFLTKPIKINSDIEGYVENVILRKCKLGEPDASGRRRPIDIEGSDFSLESDSVIIAVGLGANKLLTSQTPLLKTDSRGDVIVDKNSMQTSVKRVYAGGDIVGGEGTVIEAMGMAKKASCSIFRQLLQ